MLELPLYAEGNLARWNGKFWLLMQFGCGENTAVLYIAENGCAFGKTPLRIFDQKSIAYGAVEPIAAAFMIKAQKMLTVQL